MRLLFKMLLAVTAFILISAVLATSPKAQSQKCGQNLENQARDQPAPADWNGLYRLFKQFGSCDGGTLGERFSADVAQLFSRQWSHLDALSRFTTADKAFEQFVLRHIDTSLDEDDLLHIADNSKSHCPPEDKRICRLVHARAQNSLDKQRDASE